MSTLSRLLGAAALVFIAGPGSAAAADGLDWIRKLALTPGAPLVVLPPALAGRLVSVDEQDKENSLTQIITLAGDPGVKGENTVTVRVFDGGLAPKIDDADLAAEVPQVLPDVPLHLSPAGLRNVFGLFGAVEGQQGGLSCVYAWQRVNLADRWVSGHPANPFDRPVAMTLRYRLCRTTVEAAELVAAVEGAQSGADPGQSIAVTARFGGDPLAAAASIAPPLDLEASGPGVAVLPSPSLEHRRKAAIVRRKVVHARRPAAVVEDSPVASPAVVANAPAVPLP